MRRCLNGVFPSGSRLFFCAGRIMIQPGYTGGYARVTGYSETIAP